ncbi:uncharacterized protein LOC116347642 [Contarinia nasturtii]|uniref:uncharacterized protein LOC116347642 n=1 Tax=Contarinia nasturtii TaxID=265458 RepID=UPI0012D469BF|nr:uncharacterized protein LOC116347642 [Contarinia nasturtii]
MFRTHQCFIIDFGEASYMAKASPAVKMKAAREDWTKFLTTMFSMVYSKLNWLGFSAQDRIRLSSDLINRLLEDVKNVEQFSGLRRVFIEFAKHAYDVDPQKGKSTIPFYDQVYRIIEKEMANYAPALFSWISNNKEISLAKQQLKKAISIYKIKDPFAIVKK